MVAAVSSINLHGTMRALNLTNLGSGWVVSTPANGSPSTRRVGTTAQAAECHVESTGKLIFYTGYAPSVGRTDRRELSHGGPGGGPRGEYGEPAGTGTGRSAAVAAWIGSVTSPPARSSQDCRNAAQTMEQAASSVSALWSGTYRGTRASFAADVWPGDALLLNAPSANLNAQVVVARRQGELSARAIPTWWSMQSHLPMTGPMTWQSRPARQCRRIRGCRRQLHPTVLANLNALTVTTMSGSTVTINTGVTAADRRRIRDSPARFCIYAGEDPDAGDARIAVEP